MSHVFSTGDDSGPMKALETKLRIWSDFNSLVYFGIGPSNVGLLVNLKGDFPSCFSKHTHLYSQVTWHY